MGRPARGCGGAGRWTVRTGWPGPRGAAPGRPARTCRRPHLPPPAPAHLPPPPPPAPAARRRTHLGPARPVAAAAPGPRPAPLHALSPPGSPPAARGPPPPAPSRRRPLRGHNRAAAPLMHMHDASRAPPRPRPEQPSPESSLGWCGRELPGKEGGRGHGWWHRVGPRVGRGGAGGALWAAASRAGRGCARPPAPAHLSERRLAEPPALPARSPGRGVATGRGAERGVVTEVGGAM